MEFLASDALNGRGSGTRDEWIAATYIAAQFRGWGLEPIGDAGGYVQQIELAGAEASAPPVLTIGGASLTHGQEILVTTLGSATVSGSLTKLAAGAQASPGAIVLLPEAANPTQGAGAALVLALETAAIRGQWAARGARMPAQATRPVKVASTSAPPRPTVIYLDKDSYAAVGALAAGTPVAFAAEMKPTPSSHTWNAVGRLTGSDPTAAKEVLVLSAHLDHVGTRPGDAGTDTIFNGADLAKAD